MRIRNFRLFFIGQGISQVGNWMTLVAQALFVLKLTNSGIALGLLAAAQFTPVLILGAWAGVIADRSDKRKLLLRTQSLAMLQSFGLAAQAFTGSPPVTALYGLAVLGGIIMAFDNPTRRSLVVEMVPPSEVPNAVGLNTSVMTSSRVVGPALAGLIITVGGFGWVFLIDALSYIAVLWSLWMVRGAELHKAPISSKGRGQIRDGLHYVRSMPELLVPMVMMGVVGTLAFNFSTVLPLFATRNLGGNATTYTFIFSLLSVGALGGALIAARRKVVTVRTVGWSAVAFGVALAGLAAAPGLLAALAVGMAVGFTSTGFLTSSTAIVQLRADPVMRGRVLALQAMLFLGSTPIGGPLIGWISESFGARVGILVGAVGALLAGAWGLAVSARTQNEHAPSGPAMTPAT